MSNDYGAIDRGEGDADSALEAEDRSSALLLRPPPRWWCWVGTKAAWATSSLALLLFVATYYWSSSSWSSSSGGRGGPLAALRCELSPRSSSPLCRHHDMNRELFYRDQLVDHFGNDDDDDATTTTTTSPSTWSHRYYASAAHFGGPGHPIFHVVGGEGALDSGMLYPFVTGRLAPHFGAAVVQVEHRFYGEHRPVSGREATASELLRLLTPQQAMADNVRLGRAFAGELGCSDDRTSADYCPVVTVGGSYPGFLSAVLRLAHPDYADMSYASSAPLKLYDQSTDQNVYYDIVSW